MARIELFQRIHALTDKEKELKAEEKSIRTERQRLESKFRNQYSSRVVDQLKQETSNQRRNNIEL